MLEQTKLHLYYYWKTSWTTILTFWGIYIFFIALMFIAAFYGSNGSIMMTGVNIAPGLIFSLFFGIFSFKDTFPYVIELGLDRYSFILSSFISIILYTVAMTSISQIVLHTVDYLINLFSLENFEFSGLEIATTDATSTSSIVLYEGLLYLLFFSFSILLGSVFFRFGLKIGFTVIAIFPIMMIIQPIAHKVLDALKYIAIGHELYTPFAFFVPYGVIAILLYVIVYNASAVGNN
ncbi:hypothetical protein SH601_00735 [Gracilibacillus sp. S3-1-1]|uniref:Uncharacterized protein n=1 Tax=Gracilibacillus pellucidus TaxID=3095368 RepID=A0ACC6M0T1_9BACI|nr:hypothetical protein [Gracilibacillus sp. S3-1-1]MDX8044498.1 hypothetical protein [Gracilibacillus sp. S3-1-1]